MDNALTNDEMDQLRTAGWRIGGGKIVDGVVRVLGTKHEQGGTSTIYRTRAEWRAVIAEIEPPVDIPALVAELQAARAYLEYILCTYPPTSKTEEDLRAAYEAFL